MLIHFLKQNSNGYKQIVVLADNCTFYKPKDTVIVEKYNEL